MLLKSCKNRSEGLVPHQPPQNCSAETRPATVVPVSAITDDGRPFRSNSPDEKGVLCYW